MNKDEVKAEIKRLQELLARMEEEEKDNYPHKQLNLFEE
jgi:hypothetical protein